MIELGIDENDITISRTQEEVSLKKEQHWHEGLAYITITHYFNEIPIEKSIGCRTIEDLYVHRYEIIDGLISEIKRYEKEILRKQLTENVTPHKKVGC